MKSLKKLLALILSISIVLSLTACSEQPPQTDDEIELAIHYTGEYILEEMGRADYGDEVAITALIRSNHIDFWHTQALNYETEMNDSLSRNAGIVGEDSQGHIEKYPDVIFAFTAVGKYADKTSKANLMQGVSYDSTVLLGGYLNKIRALIAIECGDYPLLDDADVTVEDLVEFIISLQKEDGSFQYSGMKETVIDVTANAVQALALTDSTPEIDEAVQNGVTYLSTRVRSDDTIKDLANTIVALNTAGVSAKDVEGNDLTQWIMQRAMEDHSYSDVSVQDGDLVTTSYALMGLASQYRFDNAMTSYYDMSDILGGTHNKLSPAWNLYLKYVQFFIGALVICGISIYFTAKKRIAKWRAEGIYNEEKRRMMTDEEIAQRDLKRAQMEKEQEQEQTDSENTDTQN